MEKVNKYIQEYNGNLNEEIIKDEIFSNIKEKFIEAMDDDFNTPSAISNLHLLFKHINSLIETANKESSHTVANTLVKALKDIKEVYSILGFFTQEPKKYEKEIKQKYLKSVK